MSPDAPRFNPVAFGKIFPSHAVVQLTRREHTDIHGSMPSPTIEKILILQERDMRRVLLENQLKSVPAEIDSVRKKIEEEKSAADNAKLEWKALETRRKGLETEVTSGEEKVARFRSQQLMVKKNDEYQALGHEIEHALEAVGKLEEEEIAVMLELDAAKEKIAAAEGVAKGNIAGHESRIAQLKERERNLAAELEEQGRRVEEARAGVEPPAQSAYDRLVKSAGHPVCVPLKDHKCGGCHLKVSSGVESETRAGSKLAFCDNCGRVLYWELS